MKQENERREGDIPPHPVPRTAPAKPTGGHWGAAQANSPAGKQQVREPILQRPPPPLPEMLPKPRAHCSPCQWGGKHRFQFLLTLITEL